MQDVEKRPILGTTIHVIDSSEDEIEEIRPDQYQKIALSAYKTHLQKIEVIIFTTFLIL